jgi:aspartyl-tRNA(Asn)/glutamyl-tRNA(Gln) amidotransferase subunit A
MLGTFALSAGYYDQYYNKALKVRRLIKEDFDRAFEQCDLLIGPAAPTPAFQLGEKTDDPLAMYLADVYTVSLNMAGLPGLTVPCGQAAGGLPIGMQLMGPVFREDLLLQVARIFERQSDWHTRRPPVVAG